MQQISKSMSLILFLTHQSVVVRQLLIFNIAVITRDVIAFLPLESVQRSCCVDPMDAIFPDKGHLTQVFIKVEELIVYELVIGWKLTVWQMSQLKFLSVEVDI